MNKLKILLFLIQMIITPKLLAQSSNNFKIIELNELSSNITSTLSKKTFKTYRNSKRNKSESYVETDYDKYANILVDIVAQSEKYISLASSISIDFKAKLDDDIVLQGQDLSTIENLIRSLLIIAESNMQLISIFDPLNDDNINSTDSDALFRSLISYSANLNLFNIFNETFNMFLSHSALRKIVVDIYETQKEQYPYLEKLSEYLEIINDDNFRSYLINSSISYRLNTDRIKQLNIPLIDTLTSAIESIPLSKKLHTQIYVKYNFIQIPDIFTKIIAKSTNFISKLFGNLVGKIKWRHGYLYNHAWGKRHIIKNLKPLDIIAEKTPFAATDLFIPGHFGHIALYLGTEEQLREIGMWNDPLILPFQESIKSGNNILESIRPGSQLTNMDAFLEIDEITIISQPDIYEAFERLKKTYKIAFEQLGKAYDFNFDVHTLSTVVCSEVIYHAFGHIKWPTVYRFGRFTITPDDVIELAYYDNTPVTFKNSFIANSDKTILKVKKEELGRKFKFVKNKKRSTKRSDSYDRVTRTCKTVVRRYGRIKHRRVCKNAYTPLVYEN